ncbi:proprotein convertase P-domain-containing protein [Rhodanobacter aciditrophus]|uniref:proprotein convertase P-domain-containing protein n=1 Tax=Rhodanobacter aciditrophus TaxID=1623218 RepID=UPI003CF467D3
MLKAVAASVVLGLAAGPALAGHTTQPAVNPYSPAYGHSYRHGVIPTLAVHQKMKQYRNTHATTATTATSSNTLTYNGGVDGVGVMDGHVKVYIVYYGSQWGTRTTNSKGDSVFSGDADGAAAVAEEMFKGIGTGNELWSADLTQWCDGPNVAKGATSCPSNANFVPYQSGGVLAGVYYDNSAAAPSAPTQADLANEAIKAAAHFGNTAQGSNRYTYYVIMSPHGTNPDNYQGQYCAWHDYTTSSYGDIAYSNQPYNMDSGAGCGVNFVNSGSAGTLDGWTMTLGHEWHEMMSDTYPAGGWTNASSGEENSDECAWIAAGQPGGAANVAMGTGTFTEQASWSNDTNSCAISHAIVNGGGGGGGGGSPVANFTDTVNGLTVNFTDASTDTGGTISSYSWTFGDGSSSTAANPSHTYAAAGTYNVTETVTDNTGATSSKTASVTVASSGGGGGTFSNNTQQAINDNATVTSSISVTGEPGAAPSNLQVHVNITHNWSGDLEIVLYAPNGAYAILQYPDYNDDGNINKTWTVNASSVQGNGTWKLKVIDSDPWYSGDYGTLNSWSLTF